MSDERNSIPENNRAQSAAGFAGQQSAADPAGEAQSFGGRQPEFVQQPEYDTTAARESSVLAIVGMVLGIISLVCCCLGPVAVGLGIGAVVCSVLAWRKRQTKGFWITGLACGICGFIAGLVLCVLLVVLTASASETMEYTLDNLDRLPFDESDLEGLEDLDELEDTLEGLEDYLEGYRK